MQVNLSSVQEISTPLQPQHAANNQVAETAKNCFNCYAENSLKRCINCKVARYCNQSCQKNHWKTHKMLCEYLKNESKKSYHESLDTTRVYKCVSPEGIIYIGTLNSRGMPEGTGEMLYPNGDRYEGQFVDGMMNGKGNFSSQNIVRDGTFKNNQIVYGKMVDKTRNISYEDTPFRDNLPNGTGTIKLPNGIIYKGEICNGSSHGLGTLFMPDGTKIEGNFVNGAVEGWGTQKSPYQDDLKVNYSQGDPINFKRN